MAFLQLGNALAVRSERQSFFSLGWRSNMPLAAAVAGTVAIQLGIIYVPILQPIFATVALSPVELVVVLAASTLAFVGVELEKWLFRRRGAASGMLSPGGLVGGSG